MPIFASTWNPSAQFQTDFQNVIENVTAVSWFSSILSPTNLKLGDLGTESRDLVWLSVFQQLSTVLNSANNNNLFQVLESIRSSLSIAISTDPSTVFSISFHMRTSSTTTTELGVNIRVYSTRKNTFVSSPLWNQIVDTARAKFALLVKTELSFYLGIGDTQMEVSTRAKTEHRVWVAPFHYEMHSGVTKDAVIDVDFNFPGENSYVNINFDVESDMGTNFYFRSFSFNFFFFF